MINNIFQNLIVKGIIIVYLNNILIFIQTLKEYHQAVYKIIEVLTKHKMFLYPKKCEFDK